MRTKEKKNSFIAVLSLWIIPERRGANIKMTSAWDRAEGWKMLAIPREWKVFNSSKHDFALFVSSLVCPRVPITILISSLLSKDGMGGASERDYSQLSGWEWVNWRMRRGFQRGSEGLNPSSGGHQRQYYNYQHARTLKFAKPCSL